MGNPDGGLPRAQSHDMSPIQWLRSLLFVGQMYFAMLLFGLAFALPALLTRDGANVGVRVYCRYVRWTAQWMVGIRTEVRGPVPTGEVLVASKHQSFLDIIMLVSVLPRPRFIMKRELIKAPVLGLYALRIGCIPVERGAGGVAVRKMLEDARTSGAAPGQLVIYPQGTRIVPGVVAPYKVGAAALYGELGQTCVPAATNVGLFWPRRGIARRPGVAVLEFLDPIAPGLEPPGFLALLEERVEAASNQLLIEAGVSPSGPSAGQV